MPQGSVDARPLGRRSLGRPFAWLWAAYAVSTVGTWLAFDAFPLIAILVLHAGPTEVAALAAVGMAVGAVVAVPLGPWVEFRHKRPVMVTMDLTRCVAVMSVPAAYALGGLSFGQLLVVSVIVGSADIAFQAASGSHLKALVAPEDLLVANGRFESTMWTATALCPALGGLAISVLGPVTTALADAVSYLFSALGISAIGRPEPAPPPAPATRLAVGDLLDGWRYILGHPRLRGLFLNSVFTGALILATAPLLAVLMLGQLHFTPWQYGLAFGAPCVGGLIGSRLARRLAARWGRHRVMLASGTLRSCWSLGLVLIGPGASGIVLVIVVQLGLITCMGIYNPLYATARLEETAPERVARMLVAWSVSKNLTIAAFVALWGVLAGLTSPRIAIGIAGGLLLFTPLLLPRRARSTRSQPEPAAGATLAGAAR